MQSNDCRIQSLLGILPDIRGIHVFSSLRELVRQLFRASYENTIIIFMAGNKEELLEIFSISNLFRKCRTILILPDREPGTLKIGYLLEPRFISYMDSDLSDVRAIVSQMSTYSKNNPTGGKSGRIPNLLRDFSDLGIEMRSDSDRRKFDDTILIGMDRRSGAERRQPMRT